MKIKKIVKRKKSVKEVKLNKSSSQKEIPRKNYPTLNYKSEREIAMDFATKAYQKFNKIIKSIILFGSTAKQTNIVGSDIDIIIIIDDVSIRFDEELVAWYRQELGKVIKANPYQKELHINTIKLSTWWQDLHKGDAVVINVIRYGEPLIDFGGFFTPLKILLEQGKIKPTPESIYTALNRVPIHILNSKQAKASAIEACYWAFIDAAQALLMTIKILPPSPEHIPILLKENFSDKSLLKMKYVVWCRDVYDLHRKMVHGEIKDVQGSLIDDWQARAYEFQNVIISLIKEILK